MPQQLSVSQLTANDSLQEFIFNSPLINTSDRGFERTYMNNAYQTGDVINIRKQNQRLGQRGRVGVIEDVNEETTPLVIGPEYLDLIAFNSKELTLKVTEEVTEFQRRYVSPTVLRLLSMLETDCMNAAVLDTNYFVGSPTALLSDFSIIDNAYATMIELGMPTNDCSIIIGPRDGSAIKSSNQNAFNPILNKDISFASVLGHFSIFDVFTSPATVVHQAGTGAGAPVVSVVPLSGATTISMSGFTPSAIGVLTAGDTITFGIAGSPGGVESVHAVSKQATGQLMPFTVQANVNADVAGNATVTISPAIISDIANPRRNVSQNIPLNSQVNLLGANLRYRIGYAYSSRAFSLVVPPLHRAQGAVECGLATDEKTGVSLRIIKAWDQIQGLDSMRIEFIAGFKAHQQYALKMISAVS